MGLIRLILAISVLLAHMQSFNHRSAKTVLGFTFVDPIAAVQCFFMLSGFYMALVLNEKYKGPGSYVTFVTQRFFRLYPTYWLILGCVVVGELVVAFTQGNRHEMTYTMEYWVSSHAVLTWFTSAVLVVSNLALFGLNDLYLFYVSLTTGSLGTSSSALPSNIASVYTIVPPAWSLGIEVVFYSVAPFLVRRSPAWQAGLLVLLLALRFALMFGLDIPFRPYIFISAPLQFVYFLAGSLAYQLYLRRASFPRLYIGSGIPWVVLILIITLFYHRLPYGKSAWVVLYPALFFSIPALFALTKNSFWDRQIGELSYPFYLIHYSIIELANVVSDHITFSANGATIACLLVTLVLSIAVVQLVEVRIDRFRAALFQRTKHRLQPPAERLAPLS